MIEVKINTEFIKLDSFLKWYGVICTQRGKKIRTGDIVSFDNEDYKVI